jgi:translation initiation factor IF-1
MYYMTIANCDNPRLKIRGRPDGSTVTAAIPAKIAHSMRLKPGDIVEWIWTTEATILSPK